MNNKDDEELIKATTTADDERLRHYEKQRKYARLSVGFMMIFLFGPYLWSYFSGGDIVFGPPQIAMAIWIPLGFSVANQLDTKVKILKVARARDKTLNSAESSANAMNQ